MLSPLLLGLSYVTLHHYEGYNIRGITKCPDRLMGNFLPSSYHGMSKQTSRFYEFDNLQIDVCDRVLTRAGETIPLAPKAFDLLLFFMENRGRLLDKEKLLQSVWPGVFVEESNLTKNIFVLRQSLGENPAGKSYVRTFPRRGYRFDADVVERNLQPVEAPDRAPPRPPAPSETQNRAAIAGTRTHMRLLAGLGCAALLAAAAFLVSLKPRTERRVRSLAVVPFRMASPASNIYLPEAPAEALTLRLAQIRGLRVIAPQMAAHLGNLSDPQEVGRRLGVEGVITGSFRTEGGRLRASVQLIATRDGTVLWADDTLDERLENSESVRRLADSIVAGVRIGMAEHPDPPLKAAVGRGDVGEMLVRGRAHYVTAVRTADQAERDSAIRLFERVVAADPRSSDGHAWLALARLLFTLSLGEVEAAHAHARTALAIDPDHVLAWRAMIEFCQATGRVEEGLTYARRAVMRKPDDAEALALAGRAYYNAGMLQKSTSLLEQAVAKASEPEFSRFDLSLTYVFTHQNKRGLEILAPIVNTSPARWIAIFHHSDAGECGEAMALARTRPDVARSAFAGNYMIGIVAEQCGDRALARRIWSEDARRLEEALARADSPDGRSILALDYAELGQSTAVRDQVQRAQLLFPGHPYLLYYNGEAYAILGEWNLAVQYLNEAVAHGFLALHYIDHRQQPFYPLANLKDEPEFRAIRDTVASRVAALEKIY